MIKQNWTFICDWCKREEEATERDERDGFLWKPPPGWIESYHPMISGMGFQFCNQEHADLWKQKVDESVERGEFMSAAYQFIRRERP